MPKLNYYELKENLTGLGQTLNNLDEKIEEKASSVDISDESMKELDALKAKKQRLQTKYDVLKESYERENKKMQERANMRSVSQEAETPEKRRTDAFASLVRKTMHQQAVGTDIYEALGDSALTDTDTTGGNKFLPKTVSTNIITQPEEKNPLRDISTVTQIPNLEIPRLTFTLDDNSFIQDGETAKELKAKGDTVAFTRNKFKVSVGLSETVLLGSNASLTQYVEDGLRNGITVKERSVAFAQSTSDTPLKESEKHMSFYDESNGIKSVDGADLYEAITNALADLNESYRENATIVMAYKDYVKILRTLANGSATLFGVQPEQVLGKPVVFTDAAVKPVVGDFSYSQYNYDINTLYDQDKDVNTGINYFVVTGWFDHRIKLSSAFRIANVTAAGK